MGVFQRIKNAFYTVEPSQEKRSGFSLKDAFAWGYGSATKSGVSVTPDVAIGLSGLWRATDIIGSLLGVFPKKLFQKSTDGTRSEIWNHPIAALLSKMPLNDETPFVFWYVMVTRAMLFGGAAAKIIRDGNGMPIRLQILTGICTPFISTHDGKRYMYASNHAMAIPYGDCIYIPGIMILDGEKGKSIIQTFADTFGEIKAAEMFAQTYYANGGHLAGYVSYKEGLTDIQLLSRRDSWNKNYGTLDGMNGTAILDNGGEYKSINSSMKDSEATVSRTFGIAEISRITGVPLPMLGETGKTSYNNIEGMNRHFYDLTILPWVTKITQEIEKKLLPTISPFYIKINTAALLQADTLNQGQYFNMMLNNGTFSINEVREWLDMNPVEGGDKHRVQMQDVSITDTMTEDEIKNDNDGQENDSNE